MAIAQNSGVGITEMRNKLGNEVFTRNGAGQVVRAYVIPTNTITDARTAVRDNWATCYSLWNAVTPEEVIQWSIFAHRFTKRNSIAQPYKLSSRSMFVSCNANLLAVFQSPISAPVFNVLTPVIASASVTTLTTSSIILLCSILGSGSVVPANCVLSISASPSVSTGINYPRNNFRQINVLPDTTDVSATDMFTDYNAIFGAPVSGLKVFFRLSLVNVLTGLRCKPVTFAAIVA